MFGFFSKSPVRDEAHEWVEQGAVLLDVRTPAEFAGGHLDGAMNIPIQDLSARVRELDPRQKVVIYCRSGARSKAAAGALKGAGFDAVLDLGAMRNW